MRHDESDKEDEMARLKLFRPVYVLGAIALLALCAASSQAKFVI